MLLPTSPRLSEAAYDLLKANEHAYRDLVPSHPGDPAVFARLSATDPATLIAGDTKDLQMAQAVACGLWLWHDFLDEAHKIAQGLGTETGSFWHAIMHRREGNFPNSKYWYARCRNHPAFMAINSQAGIVLNDLPADNRLIKLTLSGWNPDYMVDLVEAQHARPDARFGSILTVMQQLEWRVLIEYCASLA